ncbi:hypothetical protein O181_005472 [Austropuccinia psidii MF-1]|uniref:Tet-like 2OG-Fe(II) oxygenase domain-containing protein n=1 Tax=Austropuccinia psidii MF-1 TaxID=1389203 RepID=A0A9Q3BI62_9BASI|nr:hypothetical protein [Austropuccinia psidii MF-1]
MPVSANITTSNSQSIVNFTSIKPIHFGPVAIFSETGLLTALVKFRPFTIMSEVKVNQWDELSQFLFCKREFTNPIETNGALLEGFMFSIGWRKWSMKNKQFGIYGGLGRIEDTKDEWRNKGANLSLVGCILGSQCFTQKSLCLNRFPDIQTPYAGAASQQSQHFVTPVQAPKASHANPYACTGSQKFQQFFTPVQASNASHTNTYTCTGSQHFTRTSSCLHAFLKIQKIPYTGPAS